MPHEGARLVISIDIGTVQSAVAVSYHEPGELGCLSVVCKNELTPTIRR